MSIVGFAFSANGQMRLSYGADLQPGEVWFQYMPHLLQLAVAFPTYTPFVPAVRVWADQFNSGITGVTGGISLGA